MGIKAIKTIKITYNLGNRKVLVIAKFNMYLIQNIIQALLYHTANNF